MSTDLLWACDPQVYRGRGICYLIDDQRLTVVRVLQGARDINAEMFSENDSLNAQSPYPIRLPELRNRP